MNFKVIFALLVLIVAAFASDCQSKPESGPCRARFEFWAYHPSTNKCAEFIYGGCQGNGNRYSSKEQCERACKK